MADLSCERATAEVEMDPLRVEAIGRFLSQRLELVVLSREVKTQRRRRQTLRIETCAISVIASAQFAYAMLVFFL